jgi:hypothetical protein
METPEYLSAAEIRYYVEPTTEFSGISRLIVSCSVLRRDGHLSGLVDFLAMANLDDKHYVGWLDRVDDAPILHTQPPRTPEAVPQRLAKLDGVRREFLFYGPPDSVANVLG